MESAAHIGPSCKLQLPPMISAAPPPTGQPRTEKLEPPLSVRARVLDLAYLTKISVHPQGFCVYH